MGTGPEFVAKRTIINTVSSSKTVAAETNQNPTFGLTIKTGPTHSYEPISFNYIDTELTAAACTTVGLREDNIKHRDTDHHNTQLFAETSRKLLQHSDFQFSSVLALL